jgi:hypothetical protein
MIEDGGLAGLLGSEARVGSDLLPQRFLQSFLLGEKLVEQRQLVGSNRWTVGVIVEQAVGVHGNEHGGVGIFWGDEANGAIADGQIVGEIDLFESGVLAH